MPKAASREDHASVPRRRSAHATSNVLNEPFFLQLSPRVNVFLDPKKKLIAGCYVLVMNSSKVWKLGQYWPGPPAKFAHDARSIDDLARGADERFKPRHPLPKNVAVYRVLHIGVRTDAGMRAAKERRLAG